MSIGNPEQNTEYPAKIRCAAPVCIQGRHIGQHYESANCFVYYLILIKDYYQEIVLQAWNSYPTFKGDAKFSTWLYRVCLNTIFTLKKKTNRVIYTDIVKFAENQVENPSADEKDQLYAAIVRLPETERAIVSLHLDGYDNQEISSIIGISANHTGVKLHRAKQRLSTLLNIL